MGVGGAGMWKALFEFSVPTFGMVFLAAVSAISWRKQRERMEYSRRLRAVEHSASRARMAASQFARAKGVTITGVVTLADTVLVGYRRPQDPASPVFPGERAASDGTMLGTWVAWLQGVDQESLRRLDDWCTQGSEVFIRVGADGSDLLFVEPLTSGEARLALVPS